MNNNNGPTPMPGENETDPVLQFFGWKHLPLHHQKISKPFGQLAAHLVRTLPRCPERTTTLQKLREARDRAITASLSPMVVMVGDLEDNED
jgi:hypothetical protein